MTTQPISRNLCARNLPQHFNGCACVASLTAVTAEAPEISLVTSAPETTRPHTLPENLGPLTDLDREMLDTVDEMVARRLVDGGTYNVRRADDVRFDVRQVLASLPEDEFDRRFDEIEASAEQVSILESIANDPHADEETLDEMGAAVGMDPTDYPPEDPEPGDAYVDYQAYADGVLAEYDSRLHGQVRSLVRADSDARS
jgi:hypothetical protein